jgi:hypothetical protein
VCIILLVWYHNWGPASLFPFMYNATHVPFVRLPMAPHWGPASQHPFTIRPMFLLCVLCGIQLSPLSAAFVICVAPVPFVLYHIWYPSYKLSFTVWLILLLLFLCGTTISPYLPVPLYFVAFIASVCSVWYHNRHPVSLFSGWTTVGLSSNCPFLFGSSSFFYVK